MTIKLEKTTYQDKWKNISNAVDRYDDKHWYYLSDFDEGYAYIKGDGVCYKVAYTMSEAGEVTLASEKEKVISETTYNVVESSEEVMEKSITNNLISWMEKRFGSNSGIGSNGKTTLPVIKQFEEEQMIAVEPFYIAPFETTGDIDGHDDIMYEPEVRKMVNSFNSNLEKGSLGTKESHKEDVDYYTILKAWVNECDCYIGEHFVPEGQPLVKTKFHDKKKWEDRKSGELTGVSIGASAKSVEYIEIEIEEDE